MLRKSKRTACKFFFFLVCVTLLFFAMIHEKILGEHKILEKLKVIPKETVRLLLDNEEFSVINPDKYWKPKSFEKKDWHDYDFIKYEASRKGPGEQGEGVVLTDPEDIKLNEEVSKLEGLSAIVSDKISVNRSVPDTRPPKCKEIKYLSHLPSVSVIIIFHNEYKSILHRTIHSVYNRSPKEILHEIILVNDNSTRDYLLEPLQKYVDENFGGIARIVNLKQRSGLIRARMEGAKVATGDVLVFLDAHVEANVNWLPPLIEPIALNPQVSTTPLVEYFENKNFKYVNGGMGSRGVFDWKFIYHWLPRKSGLAPEEPAENPIMLGCAFAINRQYFFDLGAYDEELRVWNGENYELSFKLWLCGGSLLEVPCSRVAHTFRFHNQYRTVKEAGDYLRRNFKRVAEVWLDEYKDVFYKHDRERYNNTDPGDLTRVKMIREKLQCKPFKYYLEVVAPDMLERFPIVPKPYFASGAIISVANPNLCVDTIGKPKNEPIGLYSCHSNLVEPSGSQFFHLTWNRNIMRDGTDDCLDAYNVGMFACHWAPFGHQFWRYRQASQMLIPGDNENRNCLTADIKNKTLSMRGCNDNDVNQKWIWGFKNVTMLDNWCKFGTPFPSDKPCKS